MISGLIDSSLKRKLRYPWIVYRPNEFEFYAIKTF